MPINSLSKTKSSKRLAPEAVPFNALLVAYKAKDKSWRGFIHPYGETTEANTKKEAIIKLRELADAYYSVLKQYDFPEHLKNAGLLDLSDRVVFDRVVGNKVFMKGIHSKEGKADSLNCYVETYWGQS